MQRNNIVSEHFCFSCNFWSFREILKFDQKLPNWGSHNFNYSPDFKTKQSRPRGIGLQKILIFFSCTIPSWLWWSERSLLYSHASLMHFWKKKQKKFKKLHENPIILAGDEEKIQNFFDLRFSPRLWWSVWSWFLRRTKERKKTELQKKIKIFPSPKNNKSSQTFILTVFS